MSTINLRIAARLFLTVLFILVAGGVFISRGAHGDAAPAMVQSKVPKELLEKRRDMAKRVWETKWQIITQTGRMPPSELLGWSERWMEAELALRDKKEERITALKSHVDRTREVERLSIATWKMRRLMAVDADAASYERLNAEIRYYEATGKSQPPLPEVKSDPSESKQEGKPIPQTKKEDKL
jgi:hypothetical protein